MSARKKAVPGVVGLNIVLDRARTKMLGERMWGACMSVPGSTVAEIIMAAAFVIYNAGADE